MGQNTWYYMWFPGIRGSVREKGHAGWVEAQEVRLAWLAGRFRGSVVGRARQPARPGAIQLVATLAPGPASVRLVEANAAGRAYDKVKIDILAAAKGGKQRVIAYVLGEVLVESVAHRANLDVGKAVCEIGFSYETISYTMFPAPDLGLGVASLASWKLKR